MAINYPPNYSKTFGNVLMLDPNLVNVNPNMVNGIPQYQDMFIFAELTAKSRGRTVIETNNNGLFSLSQDSTNQDIVVNFLGNNQDNTAPNPNYRNFTTNWYDGSTGERRQTEGFGISSINVVINSSYIPQVNIQFIDLRGLAFFNQNDSLYRILFNFPPPIFYLTLKGYYGKPLLYQLHLVKYTSAFKAENGNFVIDAQFIAMTFAPLTDVLFTYVVNFPLINDTSSMNPSSTQPPKNTYDLILKLKSLYSEQNFNQSTASDTKIYNTIKANIEKINAFVITLNEFRNDDDLKLWIPNLYIETLGTPTKASIDAYQLTPIQSTNEYDTIIQGFAVNGESQNISQRLIIAYAPTNNVPIESTTQIDDLTILTSTPTNAMSLALQNYRNKILSLVQGVVTISNSKLPKPTTIIAVNLNSPSSTQSTYMCLDITDLYVTVYNKKAELLKDIGVIIDKINTTINNMIFQKLGIEPTIYNIFKIILDDVDTFFNILRNTASKAQDHHNLHSDLIINNGSYGDVRNTTLFAFPLIINKQKTCNNISETRIAPIALSNAILNDPFPEIILVHNFINTFTQQRNLGVLFDMRTAQNEDGTYLWIPISPFDSIYGTGDYRSPYIDVDNPAGSNFVQPINLSQETRIIQVLKIILKRFYILSQNSFPYQFYNDNNYNKFFSESEAANLIVSMFNSDYTNLLLTYAKRWQKNSTDFYNFIKTNIPALYDFTEEEHKFFGLTDRDDIIEERPNGPLEGDAYTNKENPDYHGFTWYPPAIIAQTPTTTSTIPADASAPTTTPTTSVTTTINPIQNFLNDVKQSKFSKFFNGIKFNSILQFTNQNVFYVNDTNPNASTGSFDIDNQTRFLTYAKFLDVQIDSKSYTGDKLVYQPKTGFNFANTINRITAINNINNNNTGNAFFNTGSIANTTTELTRFYSIVDLWADQLGRHDTEIYDTIIDSSSPTYNAKLSALIIASNFGYTLSTFNIYPNNLNDILFNIPAAIQTPSFVPYYMGALVGIISNNTDATYNDIYNFFVNGAGRFLDSTGTLIFADIIDVNNQLASADKDLFKSVYTEYFGNGIGVYYDVRQPLKTLIDSIKNDPTIDTIAKKVVAYKKQLSPGSNAYTNILQPLIDKHTIINFSQITFKRNAGIVIGYDSLSKTNTNSKKLTINNNYFEGFFTNLATQINTKQQDLKKQKEQDEKIGDDVDILTQTYYSFKNINDKWVSSPQKNNGNLGYPFNEFNTVTGGYHLIDLFAFVDRAMNPIGDTIINPAHLIEVLNDENATVFSVLSQLLALNNFEFFPLQNFMQFKNDEWKSSFLIDTNGNVTAKPAFVCMYFGGSSSYPTGIKSFGNQFEDDCIVDLTNPDGGSGQDFNFNQGNTPGDCIPDPLLDKQKANNPFFPYGQVRAYRVRFGEQNQSMFSNIKIDSKEYPETNESIKILSRLAGDNKLQAPTPKGQNLYNLYENRSYKATITGFGNMMLQPTQYFQIENIPLFNGAYITLAVEHNIEPNKMTTNITGTKILKYPVPRVLEASSILGFLGGNTDDTNANQSSVNNITLAPNGDTTKIPQTQYNSLYNFKIQ